MFNKQLKQTGKVSAAAVSVLLFGQAIALSGIASAASVPPNTAKPTTTQSEQDHLRDIIRKGDQEINRRLRTLNRLNTSVNNAKHLTASDKATLSNEVNNEISGLTSLKAKLDSETTPKSASADAKNIVNEYRVYALVAPKVDLVKVADDQLTVEEKLADMNQKLQTRLDTAKKNGKNVENLQEQLNDMKSNVEASKDISSGTEHDVINLTPSDYNSNHQILEGDLGKLKAAHEKNQTAFKEAEAIVDALKKM